MLKKETYYFYKINHNKTNGLKIEIWAGKSRKSGNTYFKRLLPNPELLHSQLSDFEASKLFADDLKEAVEKNILRIIKKEQG